MRKFKIKNSLGAEFDLMRKDAFFHSPDGLGISYTTGTMNAGEGVFIETSRIEDQHFPTGEMVFQGYEQYNEFARFMESDGLVLCYSPMGSWQYMDIKLGSLGKSEIDASTRRLICPINFIGLTGWYAANVIYHTSSEQDGGKIYPYTYPYTYVDESSGTITILNTGSRNATCRINILGGVINPAWSLIKSGTVVATGKVDVTIDNGNKLVVDSNANQGEIAEYTVSNQYIQNLYQDSDFSTQRFIYAPPGESTLQFTHEGSAAIDAFVEVRIPVV